MTTAKSIHKRILLFTELSFDTSRFVNIVTERGTYDFVLHRMQGRCTQEKGSTVAYVASAIAHCNAACMRPSSTVVSHAIESFLL